MRRTTRISVLVAAGGVAASVTAGSAFAESGLCMNLQQQYLTAARGSTPIPGAQTAIALRASLTVAEVAANANHCRSLGIFQPGPTSACPAVMQEVDRLQASLRQSSGGNASTGSFGFSASPRSPADQLRDELGVNGCAIPDPSALGYRALCVRACDGYYFPVSPSSAGSTADAAACQATYGGTVKTELFVGPVSGDIADARSLSGARYGDQTYAFSYRTKFNAVCMAQLQDGVSALGLRSARPPQLAAANVSTPIAPPARVQSSQAPTRPADFGALILPTSLTPQAPTGVPPVMRVVGAGYYNVILDQVDLATHRISATPVPRALR